MSLKSDSIAVATLVRKMPGRYPGCVAQGGFCFVVYGVWVCVLVDTNGELALVNKHTVLA